MKWQKIIDFIFPYIEPMTKAQIDESENNLKKDICAIDKIKFSKEPERALDEAQRIAVAERERVKTAESKATTYLAVLAFLIPLVITLQTAILEKKSGHAPEVLKVALLLFAIIYLVAAGYNALRALKVSNSQRVMEDGIVDAWRTSLPLQNLTKNTLLTSRNSRTAVNDKVTRIKVTHDHLIRALFMFLLLMLSEPVFYMIDLIEDNIRPHTSINVELAKKDNVTLILLFKNKGIFFYAETGIHR